MMLLYSACLELENENNLLITYLLIASLPLPVSKVVELSVEEWHETSREAIPFSESFRAFGETRSSFYFLGQKRGIKSMRV